MGKREREGDETAIRQQSAQSAGRLGLLLAVADQRDVAEPTSAPARLRASLCAKTTAAEREVLFRAALDANEQELFNTIKTRAAKIDELSDLSPLKDIAEKQLYSLQSLNWIIIAELAKMCAVVGPGVSDASIMAHACGVIHEEITRLNSPKLVFELLQSMGKRLDERLAAKQVDLLIGSLYASLQHTFSLVKRIIVEARAQDSAPSSPAPAAESSVDDSTDDERSVADVATGHLVKDLAGNDFAGPALIRRPECFKRARRADSASRRHQQDVDRISPPASPPRSGVA